MIPKIAGYVCKWISPKFVFGYTILVSLVRFFCGPLKGPLFLSFFRDECCQNYKLRFLAKFFVRFVDLHFVQYFSVTVFVVWFFKSLVKKKREQKSESCSFRYLNSVGDVYFGHSFLQQRLFGQALTFGDRQALQIASLFLFLIISFSRFQYFNLYFGSLKLCFTNLVSEIQDNLSLIFLSSLEISNLIYFTHFRLSPSLWVISQNSSPGLSNMPKFNQSKTIQVLILWPLFGSLDRESWVVYDLMRLSSVALIK